MPTNSRENRVLIIVVAAISIALVVAWLMAVNYIKTHFHYTGKGSLGALGQNIFYSLALMLALMELAFLHFKTLITRILFYFAVLCNILIYILFILFADLSFGGDEPTTLLNYLDIFPLFCCVILFIIFKRFNFSI